MIFAGCRTPVRVIPADKHVGYLEPGQTFTAPAGGTYLVPPARMQEILHKLSDRLIDTDADQ